MYKIIIIIFLFSFSTSVSNAQISLNTDKFYAETNTLYLAGNWDKLIDTCNFAFDNGFDTYTLRMQAGMAYYAKKNYMSAIGNFSKALEFEKKNPKALEYLYLSYLFSGRYSDAQALISVMPEHLKSKLKIENVKFISGVYTEGGITINSGFDERKKNVFHGSQNIYDEQKIDRNEFYYNLSLLHRLSRRITAVNAFSYVNLKQLKQYSEPRTGLKNYDISTTQYEYYFNLSANVSTGFDVSFSLHYLNINADDINFSYNKTVIPYIPLYTPVQNKYNTAVASLMLSKYFGNLNFSLTNSYSNINDGTQYQNGISIIYYPFGNLNLYLSSNFILHTDRLSRGCYLMNGIAEPKIGFKVFRFLWLEGYSTFGYIDNYNENNGFTVYNRSDKIRNRFGINLISPVIPGNLDLFFYYQYYNLESYYLTYESNTNYILKKLINPTNKFIGGIKWTF